MTRKTYTLLKLAVVLILGICVGFATQKQLYELIIPVVLVAFLLMYLLSKKINWVAVDERDNKIAGEAARVAYTFYSITALVAGFIALSASNIQPQLTSVAYTLFYSVLGLMFLYTILFNIYRRKNDE